MKRFAALAAPVAALVMAGAAHASLPVGATAPEFTAKGALAGKPLDFDLQKQLKKGPVVLYFFPAAFTSGCTLEAHAFSDATDDFKKAGATIVGITGGNVDRVAEFSKTECRDKFAVLADPGLAISKTYDAKSTFGTREISARTSYVIGRDGKVTFIHSDMNPSKHVELTLAAVKELKK